MNFVRSLGLNRISTQVAVLIVISVLAIHALITVSIVLTHRAPPDEPWNGLAPFVRLIAAAAPDRRAQLVEQISHSAPGLLLRLGGDAPPDSVQTVEDEPLRRLQRHLGPGFRVKRSGTSSAFDVAIRMPDGGVLTARLPEFSRPLGGPIIFTVLFLVVSVTLLAIWTSRTLRAPLSRLAEAAAAFNLDGKVSVLPERGPEEIRAVAKAFNGMHTRIRQLVDDRTRMLAAMGHDLRTPITRLRLRTEFVADEDLRAQMLRDLDQMLSMADAIVSFLRDGQSREPLSKTDVASTLQTICDQYSDLGYQVNYSGLDHLVITTRQSELQRAVTNLVDNAVRYGREVVVHLARGDDAITIAVEDDGPGIPDDQKNMMLEAFVRGDEARTMNDGGGFGLGLSIARAVAEQHGGDLLLHNRSPHGLVAVIRLPVM